VELLRSKGPRTPSQTRTDGIEPSLTLIGYVKSVTAPCPEGYGLCELAKALFKTSCKAANWNQRSSESVRTVHDGIGDKITPSSATMLLSYVNTITRQLMLATQSRAPHDRRGQNSRG